MGPGGGFATADSFCQAHPNYFVTSTVSSCSNNPCAPPSINLFSSAKVYPYNGWPRNNNPINICVDPNFSSAQASALVSGAKIGLSAVGLTSTVVINSLTDSRCTSQNGYQLIDNTGTSSSSAAAFTPIQNTVWNPGKTAQVATWLATTVYMEAEEVSLTEAVEPKRAEEGKPKREAEEAEEVSLTEAVEAEEVKPKKPKRSA